MRRRRPAARLLPVYRVRTLLASQVGPDGVRGPTAQAIALVVAATRRRIPELVYAAQPALVGANLEVLGEYVGDDPVWPVRVGTGDPKRFVVVCAPTEGIEAELRVQVPSDDPWRADVENGWYTVGAAVDRRREGVY